MKLKTTFIPLAAASTILIGAPCHADSQERDIAKFASGSGNVLYLVAGAGLPLLTDGDHGKNHSLRVLDATATTVLFTEGLKALTKEKRPDTNEHNSFPSGHTSAAFAVATVQSALHPKQAGLWYLGATIIGWSRIRLNRHHPGDVVAGAALGYGVARWEVSKEHGIMLTPWIDNDKPGVRIVASNSW